MNPDLNWYYEKIKDATLEAIEVGEKIQWFRLVKYAESRLMSTDLIFTPFAVIITGDNRVTQKGCQALGYDLAWFSSCLDAHYLAEKFLEHRWVPSLAREYWGERLTDYRQLMEGVTLEEGEEYDDELLNKHSWRIDDQVLENATVVDAIEKLFAMDCWSSASELYHFLPAMKTVYPKWSINPTERWIMPFDCSDGMGGYGYEPAEVGWLAAIQRKFAEEYKKANG